MKGITQALTKILRQKYDPKYSEESNFEAEVKRSEDLVANYIKNKKKTGVTVPINMGQLIASTNKTK